MDVAAWLRELGLERYAQAFRDNDVAPAVLPELTEQDLKDLGVSLGHRRLLLKAIRELRDGPVEPRPPAPAEPPSSAARDAERRQLTVMFVDLVGSTALSARLDPEDMREVIRDYQNAVAGEIARFEGHVAKFMGDGVLAYFGWPSAHEDEAERAIRAGLAITAAIERLRNPAGEALAARVGIATGLVIVGDLIGEGAAQEQAVVGDTPNLAARLQGIAAPGQVVIAAATRRLLGAGFELADLGEHELKGLGEPLPAFAVTGERPVESRFEAMSGPTLLPMVGRDQELALLLERWAQAKAGEGQGVLLVGEAGIGKSRISRALLDALAEEPHFRVRYQCSPYHADSALWPVIQQLSHAAGLAPDDPAEVRLDKLEALLDRAGGREAAPLIADLLGLDGRARYGPLDLTGQAQRTRTLDALIAQLLGLAARQPVLMVAEDAHWIDPTTLEMIEQGLDRIAAAPVLLLLTSRSDRQPALAGHPHVTRLTLNRLGRAGVEAIVARLVGDRLPTATIDAIIARSDGVPLFVEELTKAVLETGEASIPVSLQDSLMARLDRIPEVRAVVQIAACIGREFDYPLLVAVADQPERDLRSALERLSTAELIFRRGIPPQASYSFKHALVRDAAYHTLLRSRRQQLHGRVAEVLEENFATLAQSQPELLAHHFTQAGVIAKAIAYTHRAGQLAANRGAFAEAIAYCKRGLELIGNLPNEPETQKEHLALQSRLADLLMTTKGYAAPEVGQAFARALELCEPVATPRQRSSVLRGIYANQLVRGNFRFCVDTGRQTVRLGQRENDPEICAVGHTQVGHALVQLGNLVPARRHFDKALARFEVASEMAAFASTLRDPYQELLGFASFDLLLLGHPDRARDRIDKAIAWVEGGPAPQKVAHPLSYSLRLSYLLRDDAKIAKDAMILGQVSDKFGLALYRAVATFWQGWLAAKNGRPGKAITLLESGVTAYKATGALWMVPFTMLLLADAHRSGRGYSSSLEVLDDALAMMEEIEARWLEADIQRRRGEMLFALGRVRQAEESLSMSLSVARRQQARWWELRAATSLARFWAERGERQKAHDLLASVYEWFTEGFNTPDLKGARALLEELR